jgi:hypothetical protein
MSDIFKFKQPQEPELTKEDFVPGTLKNPKPWGILDTKTNTWMGTTVCPWTFGHRTAAQMFAQILSKQLEVPMGRHMAKPYTGANVKVEDISVKVSFEEALKRVCGE